MEMLEKAVAELKGEEIREEIEPQIKLRLAAFIPEEYIADMALRLSMYKRLTSIKSVDDLDDFSVEMTDRFGRMPEEVLRLIHVIRIKMLARLLFIGKVVAIDSHYRFTIGKDESGRAYPLPEGFGETILKALFETQKDYPKGSPLRLLQDGFEFNTKGMQPGESMHAVEEILKKLAEKMMNKL
jgi:transcription-repair coupling factor (superfamily II helicase)